VTTYSEPGTYSYAVTGTSLTVEVWGAGGGGGGGEYVAGGYTAGAGGGGGGGYAKKTAIEVIPGQQLSVIVGRGGAGGDPPTAGQPGGTSAVGDGGSPPVAPPFQNPGAVDYVQISGYAYGAQARWTNPAIAHNSGDIANLGHTNHAIWVGTNGTSWTNDWVELGLTRGFQGNGGYFYYAAHGLGGGAGGYQEFRLDDLPKPPCPPQGCTGPPPPQVGDSHLFSIFNSHGTSQYDVGIDNTFYWAWDGHGPSTPDFVVGIETTCPGCTNTYVRNTPVSALQWQDDSFNLNDVTNGTFQSALTDAHQLWCSQPTSFANSYASSFNC
jgi:hypothetical protein